MELAIVNLAMPTAICAAFSERARLEVGELSRR
jgi:hypothetical protein